MVRFVLVDRDVLNVEPASCVSVGSKKISSRASRSLRPSKPKTSFHAALTRRSWTCRSSQRRAGWAPWGRSSARRAHACPRLSAGQPTRRRCRRGRAARSATRNTHTTTQHECQKTPYFMSKGLCSAMQSTFLQQTDHCSRVRVRHFRV